MSLTAPSLRSRNSPLASAKSQIARLDALDLEREFQEALNDSGLLPLRPTGIEIFQVNVGKLCNQTCRHCHVDAGPDRPEVMTRETMEACVAALAQTDIPTVDITGGAPELNPDFRWLVDACRALDRHVIDRCNLTILELPSQRDLAEFLASRRVEVVASLPHYRSLNTDRQRGDGVYEKSIAALRRLNALGYGDGASGLRLVLVTNPVGAFLPAAQASLEAEWKRELLRLHGVRFDALYCVTNMPISRYLEWLIESGNLEPYLERLVASYNPAAAVNVMCRNTISIGWDGRLYDCDFNQMLELGVERSAPQTVFEFDRAALERRAVVLGRHCFG
ncbi:MAG: arsenosugar biosynthesis radical SAM (seleno)protein ArsS, partial [Candidatus Binatia bacterium]